MRDLITKSFSTSITSPPSSAAQSNIVKNRTLILPKPASSTMTRYEKHNRDHNDSKQQANCTSFIELKPITATKQKVATNNARVIRLSLAKSGTSNIDPQANSTSPSSIRLVTDSDQSPIHSNSTGSQGEPVPLVPKQINIIKPLSSSSSSITPAVKLSNPVLISHKSQQSSTK